MARFIISLLVLVLAGCAQGPPPDSSKVINPGNPGAKVELAAELIPDQINLVYFHADW